MSRTGAAVRLLPLLFAVALRPSRVAALSYKLTATYVGSDNSYGLTLAVDGGHVVVGAPSENVGGVYGRGGVYVYDRATGALQRHLVSPDPAMWFGDDLAIDGGTLFVGETQGLTGERRIGAAHVFDLATGSLQETLPNPQPSPRRGRFGSPIAAAPDALFIASPWPEPDFPSPGGAVYRYDPASRTLLGSIEDPTHDYWAGFGYQIARNGGEVLVSAPFGYVDGGLVYRYDAATGAPLGTIANPDPATAGFGSALAVAGSHLVVGAESWQHGAAHVFDRTTGALSRTLTDPAHNASDRFGAAIAAAPSGVVVADAQQGWPYAYLLDADSGALRWVFTLAGGPPEMPRRAGRVVTIGDDVFVSFLNGQDPGVVARFTDACGDGIRDPCELCDDGNRVDGDGCSAACVLESCGDGVLDPGEECDDGNAVDGDGCDTTCMTSRCGNCVVAGAEQCDDGNAVAGDGCDPSCTFSACGNGFATGFEQCDDGNLIPGDGCSPSCKAEICGDGVLDAGESCDDHNLVAGDGCDAACRLETQRLDWWKPGFDVYAGDFNPYYGGRQFVVGAEHVLVSMQNDDRVASAYDRDSGALAYTFPETFAGLIQAIPQGYVIGDPYGPHYPVMALDLYDPTTFALLHTFVDPTPATDGFGFAASSIGDQLLLNDSVDGAAYVFDAGTGAFLYTLTEPPAPPGTPAPSPSVFGRVAAPLGARAIVAGSYAAYVIEPATGAFVRRLAGPNGALVVGPAMVVDGEDVLVPAYGTDSDPAVYLIDGSTGAVRHTFRSPIAGDRGFGYPRAFVGGDVVVGGSGVVHRFDRASGALRYTIRNPEPDAPGCFGSAPVYALALGIVVSDPCYGNDQTGRVYLFSHDDGHLLAVIDDPNGDYRDAFYARGAYDATILTKFERTDDGYLVAYRPCIDGVLQPGDECDDGNLVNGDGCDVSCTETRCGNGIATAGEECDDGNRSNGDGCENDCTRTAPVCAGDPSLASVRLEVRRFRDGRAVVELRGRVVAPPGTRFDASASVATGMQVSVTDVDGDGDALLDLVDPSALAPGAACGRRDGWRLSARRASYRNVSNALPEGCVPGSAQGLRRIHVATFGRGARMAVVIRAETELAALPAGGLRAAFAFGTAADGGCAARIFAPAECRRNAQGNVVDCR